MKQCVCVFSVQYSLYHMLHGPVWKCLVQPRRGLQIIDNRLLNPHRPPPRRWAVVWRFPIGLYRIISQILEASGTPFHHMLYCHVPHYRNPSPSYEIAVFRHLQFWDKLCSQSNPQKDRILSKSITVTWQICDKRRIICLSFSGFTYPCAIKCSNWKSTIHSWFFHLLYTSIL